MNHELVILIITAISLGFFHTIVGPDHYVPFIVMSHARRWSLVKTTIITIVCGLGHVLSSVLLGCIGIAMGIAVSRLEGVESIRGELAAWLLISFGFTYGVWGLHRAIRTKPHQHGHHHQHRQFSRHTEHSSANRRYWGRSDKLCPGG